MAFKREGDDHVHVDRKQKADLSELLLATAKDKITAGADEQACVGCLSQVLAGAYLKYVAEKLKEGDAGDKLDLAVVSDQFAQLLEQASLELQSSAVLQLVGVPPGTRGFAFGQVGHA